MRTLANRLNEDGIPAPDAGRKRKGVSVSGEWRDSTVRSVLENPIYCGTVAWGRRSEGTTYRYDRESSKGFREAEWAEINRDTGKGRKTVYRDRNKWTTAKSPIDFEPIVPIQVWIANYERLDQAGSEFGLRGRKKCPQPNKYPLDVICGQCGEPMRGMKYNDRLSYKCGSYHAKGSKACGHNWVERDVVVWFAINAIKDHVEQLSRQDALTEKIREEFQRTRTLVKSATKNVDRLREERQTLKDRAIREYSTMRNSESDFEREVAETEYKKLLARGKELDAAIKALEKKDALQSIDVEQEVERTLEILKKLHLFLEHIPEHRLRETFHTLGARMTIYFETKESGRGKGRRSQIPVRTELELGVGAGRGSDGDGGTLEGLFEAAEAAETSGPQLYTKGGRGDWI